MSEFFGSLWWFVLTLGVLVTFHEFGHYWVARRCGVKVLRFSVGFGRALWSRTARDGTEYQIAMIPLGGYVKMLDEREGPVAQAELPMCKIPIALKPTLAKSNLSKNVTFLIKVFVVAKLRNLYFFYLQSYFQRFEKIVLFSVFQNLPA